MNHHYKDITDRLGTPKWWDEHAVPRYCDFSPDEGANIYAREVALVEIACQDCDHRFLVAFSSGPMDSVRGVPSLEKQIVDRELHYGDPPNFGCCAAGPTMNSVPLRVVEFWRRGVGERWEDERVQRLECEIVPEWAA